MPKRRMSAYSESEKTNERSAGISQPAVATVSPVSSHASNLGNPLAQNSSKENALAPTSNGFIGDLPSVKYYQFKKLEGEGMRLQRKKEGKLFYQDPKTREHLTSGEMRYVGFEDGTINVLSNDYLFGHGFFHTSIAGNDAFPIAAGELFMKDGTITMINNNSGHFASSEDSFLQFVEGLRTNGILKEESEVNSNPKSKGSSNKTGRENVRNMAEYYSKLENTANVPIRTKVFPFNENGKAMEEEDDGFFKGHNSFSDSSGSGRMAAPAPKKVKIG